MGDQEVGGGPFKTRERLVSSSGFGLDAWGREEEEEENPQCARAQQQQQQVAAVSLRYFHGREVMCAIANWWAQLFS